MLNNEKFDFLWEFELLLNDLIKKLDPSVKFYSDCQEYGYDTHPLTPEERNRMLSYLTNLYVYVNGLMEDVLIDNFTVKEEKITEAEITEAEITEAFIQNALNEKYGAANAV